MIRSPHKRSREIVRKIIHVSYGIIVAVLLSVLSRLESLEVLSTLFVGGLILSELHLRKVRVPGIFEVLKVCDRDHHLTVRPGRGPIRFTLGAIIVRALFSARITIASVLLLTFVDSVSALVGGHYGHYRIPWSKKKSFEGSFSGFLAGIIIGSLILPLTAAVVASFVAAFTESFDIDDNVPVPLAAAISLSIMGI